jgi:DUF971 family protein
MTEKTPWPTEVRLHKDRRTLSVRFDDGAVCDLPAEMLRVLSPSAEVQGHTPDQRQTVGGKRDVAIRQLEPVGNYAVKIVFDDGHDSGLFSWTYLRQLGDQRAERWTAYLNELASKGMSRDR